MTVCSSGGGGGGGGIHCLLKVKLQRVVLLFIMGGVTPQIYTITISHHFAILQYCCLSKVCVCVYVSERENLYSCLLLCLWEVYTSCSSS